MKKENNNKNSFFRIIDSDTVEIKKNKFTKQQIKKFQIIFFILGILYVILGIFCLPLILVAILLFYVCFSYNTIYKELLKYNDNDISINNSIENKGNIYKTHEELYLQNKHNDFDEILSDIRILVPNISKDNNIKKKFLKDFPELEFSSLRKNTPYKYLEKFIAIDTETTGLRPAQDELLEISAVKFIEFRPVECLTTLIKPTCDISRKITSINNIDNNLVSEAPSCNSIIESFSNYLKGYTIIGYNLEFDLKFLHVNGINIFDEKRRFFDVMKIAKTKIKKSEIDNYKLQTVCNYFNIIPSQKHRAMADALATGLIFKELYNDIK